MAELLTQRSHHHGNLRQALVEAGFAMLAEGQTLTLRQVAARAGVSHAAPAHHFSGLAGLRTAIAARAFERFADSMETRRDAAGSDPQERLNAICQGYADFAQCHARLFDLMFASSAVDHCDQALTRASGRAYAILKEGCAPFAVDDVTARRLEVTVWSLIHGYAGLGFHSAGVPGPIHAPPDIASVLRPLIACFRRQSGKGSETFSDFPLAPLPPSD